MKFGFHRNYYEEAKSRPKGFYYLRFFHTYKDITDEELNVRLDLAKELIAQDQGRAPSLIGLKSKEDKYGDFSRTEVYYAFYLGKIIGKLSLHVIAKEDSYDLDMSFSEHKITSKSSIDAMVNARIKAPYRPFNYDPKTRLRYAARHWRRKTNHSKGDIKSNE